MGLLALPYKIFRQSFRREPYFPYCIRTAEILLIQSENLMLLFYNSLRSSAGETFC
jgi:hypothetical protein